MSDQGDLIGALSSPPWNLNPYRAAAVVAGYRWTRKHLEAWDAFALKTNRRLAMYLLTKQEWPPAAEPSHTDLVLKAMEKTRKL